MIPSFGEGWGRPHVESLSCGTPVIATNWSGVTAYLNEGNGYPIAIEDTLAPSRYMYVYVVYIVYSVYIGSCDIYI